MVKPPYSRINAISIDYDGSLTEKTGFYFMCKINACILSLILLLLRIYDHQLYWREQQKAWNAE